MTIIPAIDLIGGKCVRLFQGDYGQEKQYGDPVEIAKRYADAGLKRLHLVDLDGAKGDGVVNAKVLRAITRETNLVVDFGGGIKNRENLLRAYENGASMVTCGSIAVDERETVLAWKEEFGEEKLIIGCDVSHGYVATHGWKTVTSLSLFDFVSSYWNDGFKQYICTDISCDGTLTGPSFELYRQLLQKFPSLHLIASGGVSCYDDLLRLQAEKLSGVIVGKALLEGKITLGQLAAWRG